MKQKLHVLCLFTTIVLLSSFPVCASAQRAVEIHGTDSMKFDVTQIDAKPGEQLQVTLKNTGSLPKTAMAHNWVLLKKGNDPLAYANAAAKAKDEGYLPSALSSELITATNLLGPGESDTVTFTAPSEPGDYVYLCSFPAHYMVGMKGILSVK